MHKVKKSVRSKYKLPEGTHIPDHIAIIPDGNRRWARARNLSTLEGHRKGFQAAVEIGRAARSWGIHTVTLWGWSTENWDRSEREISYLMKLYSKLLDDYLKDAHKEKVKIIHIGRKDRIPKFLLKKIYSAQEQTKNYTKYNVNIGIDYGGQDDILRAVKKIIRDGVKEDEIEAKLFERYVDNYDQPYPYVDLMIRSSGEQRTSGFMLWQSAYTEYYWENDHFPDFTPDKLKFAIIDYSRRRRRFGGNDAEEHLKFRPKIIAGLEFKWWRLGKIPENTKFTEYTINHIKEQFGMSKKLSTRAAKYMALAVLQGRKSEWKKAKDNLAEFYTLVRDEIKMAFEPQIAANLEVKLWQEMNQTKDVASAMGAEELAKNLYAETYRFSHFQAGKVAHLRVMAGLERKMAEAEMGEEHWDKAEDYLEKFYRALKERVA